MRVLVALLLSVAPLGCKRSKPAGEPQQQQQTYDPYKNVAPAKVKADVEKIQQQHEEKLDKEIESAKTAQ
jgi:hypothetical protein